MSQNLVRDGVENVGFSPRMRGTLPELEPPLTPERKEALTTRAREIIAGQVRPSPMITPPAVEEFLQREFNGVTPSPTSEVVQRITDRLSLEAHFGGRPVAYFITADGSLAVLASGNREIEALLQGLSDLEGAEIVVTDTE